MLSAQIYYWIDATKMFLLLLLFIIIIIIIIINFLNHEYKLSYNSLSDRKKIIVKSLNWPLEENVTVMRFSKLNIKES